MYQVETHLNVWLPTGPCHITRRDAQEYILFLRSIGDTSRLRIIDTRCTATGTPPSDGPSVQCSCSTAPAHEHQFTR